MQEELPSLREFNPSIPQSVENIVIKATAKNLNDRYKNASEMLEDLQTCLSRGDEEKLVFNHDGESDPTIVANPRQIFDNSEEETKEEVVEERSTRKPKKHQHLKEIRSKNYCWNRGRCCRCFRFDFLFCILIT